MQKAPAAAEYYMGGHEEGGEIKCCLFFPVRCGFLTVAIFQTCGVIMFGLMISALFAVISLADSAASSFCAQNAQACANIQTSAANAQTQVQTKKEEGGMGGVYFVIVCVMAGMVCNLVGLFFNYGSHCAEDSHESRYRLVKACNCYIVSQAVMCLGWVVAAMSMPKGAAVNPVPMLLDSAVGIAVIWWWRMSANQYAEAKLGDEHHALM